MGYSNPPLRWRLVGWWQCLMHGRTDAFLSLCGQAAVETAHFTSNVWKSNGGAWCMWYSATGTPNATKPLEDHREPVARYDGLFRYSKMWKDRLRWDRVHDVRKATTTQQYIDNVQQAGWFGSVSGVPIIKASYTETIASVIRNWTWWLLFPLSYLVGASPDTEKTATRTRWAVWVLIALLIGTSYLVIRYAYRKLKGTTMFRNR